MHVFFLEQYISYHSITCSKWRLQCEKRVSKQQQQIQITDIFKVSMINYYYELNELRIPFCV